MMPAFSHFFLKRRRALSKDSPSFTLMPGKQSPLSEDLCRPYMKDRNVLP